MSGARPAAKVYAFERVAEEDGEGAPGSDTFGLIGMILTVITMFTRSKLMAWMALFLVLSSVFNARSRTLDCGRVMSTLMFVVMALVTVYITPDDAPGPVEQLSKMIGGAIGGPGAASA